MRWKTYVKLILGFAIVILLYLLLSSIIQQNSDHIDAAISGKHYSGIPIYILIMIFDVVILPLGIPFIPVISQIYGVPLGILLTLVGWLLGCTIAFFIARKYGMRVVKKLASKKSIDEVEKILPRRGIFFFIIFLRMFLPLDVGSYGLGIFSKVSYWKYILASAIGVLPTTIILLYIGQMPLPYELLALILGAIFIFVVLIWYLEKRKKK